MDAIPTPAELLSAEVVVPETPAPTPRAPENITQLKARLERYLKRDGVKVTTTGREIANDPRLVADLRDNRQIGPRLHLKIADYLDAKGVK